MPDWPILPYRPLAQPSLFSRLGWHILSPRPSLEKETQVSSTSLTRSSTSSSFPIPAPLSPSSIPTHSPIRTSLLEAFPPPPERPLSIFALPGLRRRSSPSQYRHRHSDRETTRAVEPIAWTNPHPFLPPDHPFVPSTQPSSDGHGSPNAQNTHPHVVDLEAESPTRLVHFDYGPRGTLRPRMSVGNASGDGDRPFSETKALRIAHSRTRRLAATRGSQRSSSSSGESSIASSSSSFAGHTASFVSSLRSVGSLNGGYSSDHPQHHGFLPSPEPSRTRAILELLNYLVGTAPQAGQEHASTSENLKHHVIALRRLREVQALLERLRRRLYTDNFTAMSELAALGLPPAVQCERELHLDSWWTGHSILLSEVHFALIAQMAAVEALLEHRVAQIGKEGRSLRKRWSRVVGLSKAEKSELTAVLYRPPLDQMKTVQTVWKLEEEGAMPSGTFARYKAKRQTQSLSALDEPRSTPSERRRRRWSLTADERAEAALLGVRAVDMDDALSREREGWRARRRSALLPSERRI